MKRKLIMEFGLPMCLEILNSKPEGAELFFYDGHVLYFYRDNGAQAYDPERKSWGFCTDPQERIVETHPALIFIDELLRQVKLFQRNNPTAIQKEQKWNAS